MMSKLFDECLDEIQMTSHVEQIWSMTGIFLHGGISLNRVGNKNQDRNACRLLKRALRGAPGGGGTELQSGGRA